MPHWLMSIIKWSAINQYIILKMFDECVHFECVLRDDWPYGMIYVLQNNWPYGRFVSYKMIGLTGRFMSYRMIDLTGRFMSFKTIGPTGRFVPYKTISPTGRFGTSPSVLEYSSFKSLKWSKCIEKEFQVIRVPWKRIPSDLNAMKDNFKWSGCLGREGQSSCRTQVAL